MGLNDITIVIQPLGRKPEVLGPPLARYRPDIIVLMTSEQNYADEFGKHLDAKWQKYVNNPLIIVKIVSDPWTSDSVDRFMVKFDEAVKEIEEMPETRGKNLNWHVGTAGGTNPMAIGAALSAFTHRFPVYYSQEKRHNLNTEDAELAIDIDLFLNLGPGYKALQKERSMKIMKFIAKFGPVAPTAISEHFGFTKQNESAGRGPLVNTCLITKTDNGEWIATNLAKALLAMMAYEEE
jgi:hypothetical protein